MNAPASFAPSAQYRRLFGLIPPAVAITVDPLCSSRDDGNLGPPAPLCDPTARAGHLSPSLADIAALRARHVEKGHTPEGDAQHGWLHFKRLSDEAFRDAIAARSAEARRERLIIAVAILVALIDAEDFLTLQRQQQEPAA